MHKKIETIFYKYIIPVIFIAMGLIIYASRGEEGMMEAILFSVIGVIYLIAVLLWDKYAPSQEHDPNDPGQILDKIEVDIQQELEDKTPVDLEAFKKVISVNQAIFDRNIMKMAKIQTDESTEPGLTDSKFGGEPYWPKGKDFPKDAESKQLAMIVQINCADVPAFLGWPKQGLVQFFVALDNEFYGADIANHTNNDGFKVIYHESTDEEHEHQSIHFDDPELPYDDITHPKKLIFSEAEMLPHTENAYIDPELSKIIDDESDDYIDYWYETYGNHTGHQIGGYAHFVQADPRSKEDAQAKYSTLLLQLDSDDGFQWGDCGTAQFFISPEDLKNKDFSKVMYDWACH